MADGTPYSPEIKAEALVLVNVDGMSHEQAVKVLADRYPDRSPALRIIYVWCAQDANLTGLAHERMRDLWADQIALNDLLYERAKAEAPQLKGYQAVVAAAIGMDKEVKIIEALTGPKMPLTAQNIQINFIVQKQPDESVDTIEGEVVE